jgi:hypothetical protein
LIFLGYMWLNHKFNKQQKSKNNSFN